MTLRVAMLIHDYFPLVGGAQTLLQAQAPRLKALGVDVHILTRSVSGTPAFEEMDGISVHRLPARGPRALASLSFTLAALNCLRRLKPSVIHANEFISPATVALLAKRLWGTPVVVTPHRSGPLGDVQRLQTRTGGAARLNALKQNVDGFVVISQEIDDELRQSGFEPDRLHLIRNGVDTGRFAPVPAAKKPELRRALDLPVDATIAVFTGRLVQEKRLHNLLSVWAAVRAARPDAELMIIGEGDQEAQLRAMASPGVHLLGAKPDVARYLQASDVFVLPSAAEGLSIAMLEAMSSGLAPVVTRVGGAADVITHDVNGLLIEPDDLPELQQAMTRILVDDALRSSLAAAARTRIETVFSVDVTVDRLFELYTTLAGKAEATRR